MNSQSTTFRSKTDREREVHLEKNYREIGIPALAAASNPSCKTQGKSRGRNDSPLPRQQYGSAATD